MSIQPYIMLIGSVQVPITPNKITIEYNGQNKTVNLIDGSVINVLNPSGLTAYKFKLVLPKQTNLPFSNIVISDLNNAEEYNQDYYLKYFNDVFKNSRTVVFTIWRSALNGGREMDSSNDINISGDGIITYKNVTIESYSVNENAENAMDIEIDLKLLEYVGYGTQKIKYIENTKLGTLTSYNSKTRSTNNKDILSTYTVKSGDTLIGICKNQLGDANKWQEVAKLNNIENANKIYVGQVLKLR